MKKQEIKKLSKDEVLKNIDKLKKDLFNFRFQRINSEIKDPSKIGQTKKTIAKEALYKASAKLPIKTKFIKRWL